MGEGRVGWESRDPEAAGYGPEVPAGYRRTEVGVIPEDWETRRLGEMADVDPENLPASTPPGFSFNYISIDDVDAGRLSGYTEESFETAPSRARRVVRAGDILMSTVRPLLQGHLLFGDQLPNAVCSTGFAVLRARRDQHQCEPHFLFAHLFGDVVDAQLRGLLVGSNYPAVSGSDVRGLQVTCPPTLSEQRAIAAVLSDVDELIGSLEALIAKKRDIKRAAMQQLLTGRARLPGFGGEWEMVQLSQVADVTMGQSPPSASYNVVGNGLPLIQGKADIMNRKSVQRTWTGQPGKRCGEGDVILTVRAPVGSVARASTDACLGRGVCGLRAKGDNQFLYYALVLAELRWEELEQGSTFAAANSHEVAAFTILVPEDGVEQRAIATVLSDMDAEIAALEHRLDKTRALKRGMMQQLLTGAIRLPIPDTAPHENAEP